MTALALPDLFILRHGETVWNVEGRMQGRFDSDLTLRGQVQSVAMGAGLRQAGVGPETHCWISSPQGRAVATARLARGDLGAVHLDERLAEIGMGDWAGLTRAEIDARWPGPPTEDMIAFYARIPNGESFDDLETRLTAFLNSLTGPTVIVTHGMTARFLRMIALGVSRSNLLALSGGQGVIHHLQDGQARLIDTGTGADGLHPDRSTCIGAV